MKTILTSPFFLLIAITIISTIGCKKSISSAQSYQPEVMTFAAIVVDSTTIQVAGLVTNDYGQPLSAAGLVWCLTDQVGPSLDNNVIKVAKPSDQFGGTITGLKPHTTYKIKAFAEIGNVPGYGNIVSATTP